MIQNKPGKKIFSLFIIAVLIQGCSLGKNFSEISTQLEPVNVKCFSAASKSSDRKIQRGRSVATANIRGAKAEINVECEQISGLLAFSQPYIASHELQHILAVRYPDVWLDPDVIRDFQRNR